MATAQFVRPAQLKKPKQESITLKGSAALVGDYLHCAINSILYMRGIYPAEMFESVQKYGMCIFDAKDEDLKAYLNNLMKWARGTTIVWLDTGISAYFGQTTEFEDYDWPRLLAGAFDKISALTFPTKSRGPPCIYYDKAGNAKNWMVQEAVTKVVLVITNPDTKETVERWQFDVVCEQKDTDENLPRSVSANVASKLPKGLSMDVIRRQIGSILKQIIASVSILPATPLDTVNSFNILVYTTDNTDVPADWQESNAHIIPNAQQLRFRKIDTSRHQVDTCVTYRSEESGQ